MLYDFYLNIDSVNPFSWTNALSVAVSCMGTSQPPRYCDSP